MLLFEVELTTAAIPFPLPYPLARPHPSHSSRTQLVPNSPPLFPFSIPRFSSLRMMLPLRPAQFVGLLLATAVLLFLSSSLWSSSSTRPSISNPQPIITKPRPTPSTPHAPKRVAIVGGGASGSSAAFFLSRAAREAGIGEGALEIVVYEKNDYVGGSEYIGQLSG